MTFDIAPTRARDITALQDIERAASEMFRGTGLIPFPPEGPSVADATFHESAIMARLSWTAHADARPAGFVIGMRQIGSHYLAELSVDPAYGRRGIGAALVEYFCAAVARDGAEIVTLSTFRDVAWNAPFYRKHGFSDVPRGEMTEWMLRYEQNQIVAGLDIEKRLFMRRAL